MSEAAFYRNALDRSLSSEERQLVESCLARAEQIDALISSLAGMIMANRSRREGRQVKLTKSQQSTIQSFERDSQQAESALINLMAKVRSPARLLKMALESERTTLRMDEAVYTGGHPENEALARPVLELRRANIAELEAFLSRAKAD